MLDINEVVDRVIERVKYEKGLPNTGDPLLLLRSTQVRALLSVFVEENNRLEERIAHVEKFLFGPG